MCSGPQVGSSCQGAGGGTRTHIGLRPGSCENPASTNCATPAPVSAIDVNGNRDARRQETVPLVDTSVVRSASSCVIELMRVGAKQGVFLAVLATLASSVQAQRADRHVYLDNQGVVRWRDDRQEVTLFGANYVLPTASDYRAAGYLHADRKKMIDEDMAQFARMGWDGLRLTFWGDWEASDSAGNLIANDHLDLQDYLIAKARERGMYMLFSPIQLYGSNWPDALSDTSPPGFGRHFGKARMGTDSVAIAAQVNYLRQILNHVNRYTGVALKDEPAILFVELVNEPWHHPEDLQGSIRYINALTDAVRSTGCQKLVFYNVSQDFRIAEAIRRSRAQGVTFGWYPTGLNSGHELEGNYLRAVDTFPDMLRPELARSPRIVYEFDSPDLRTGYMYPAMARTFRAVGAQFAAMFAYDMLQTASRNLGWQTHYLNLVYTPRKAMSAIIAAEAMHRLPRLRSYSSCPEKVVTRAISRSWPMTLALPDLGTSFTVQPLTAGSLGPARAIAGRFAVTPGVYVLSSTGPVDVATLPASVGAVGFAEYHTPAPDSLPPAVQALAAPEYLAGRPAELVARVVDRTPPDSVKLFIRPMAGGFYRGFALRPAGGYEYAASVPGESLAEGPHEFVITLFRGDSSITFPGGLHLQPTHWDYYDRASWKLDVVGARTPVRLFDPGRDAAKLVFTRIGDAGRRGLFRVTLSEVTGQPAFHFELPVDARGWSPPDYTASLVIADRIKARQETIGGAAALRVRLRGLGARQLLHVTLMENDGTSWNAAVPVDSSWSEQTVPLTDFAIGRGVLLPEGFPGEWNYWVGPAAGRGTSGDRPRLERVERLQLSLRRKDAGDVALAPGRYGVEVESITLGFGRLTGQGSRR